jgi:hypothetical protein
MSDQIDRHHLTHKNLNLFNGISLLDLKEEYFTEGMGETCVRLKRDVSVFK